MEYSVIIPLFNEEESLKPLQARLSNVMDTFSSGYEIIYVDDGSNDSSLKVLKNLTETFPNIRVVSFKKNKGQSAALSAGFKAAEGKWIATLDADLQNPPEEIGRLAQFKDNFDFITGIRENRKDNFIKKIVGKIGWFFIWLALRDTTKDPGCSLKLFKRDIIESIPFPRNFHRFFTFLVKIKGFLVKEVYVGHNARRFGKSKYGIIKRAFEGITDLWEMFLLKRQMAK